MIVVPTLLVVWLVWLPAIGFWFCFSFTNWNGIGSIGDARFLGLKNYHDVTTIYPPFWPAVRHNLVSWPVTFLVATPLGCSGGTGSRNARFVDLPDVVLSTGWVCRRRSSALSGSDAQPRPGAYQCLTGSKIHWAAIPSTTWQGLVAPVWRHAGSPCCCWRHTWMSRCARPRARHNGPSSDRLSGPG